jgi:ribosomal protein L3 glutamine methyltransferase
MTLIELIEDGERRFTQAGIAFGQGTLNAFDEAAWLALFKLGLPLETPLTGEDSQENRPVSPEEYALVASLFEARINTRKPAAYLTHEAWLQGVSFYVDERVIVPRSLIAEVLTDGTLDFWVDESMHRVLDLCTGSGALAVLAAVNYPHVIVTAADICPNALAVAQINVDKHGLHQRVSLLQSDGFDAPALHTRGPFDLIVCNPPYVNAASMAALPPEFVAEPRLALDGNVAGGSDGMDLVRRIVTQAASHLKPEGVLLLEVGHERAHFEAAFPTLEAVWLDTSAGDDQVVLLTHAALVALAG